MRALLERFGEAFNRHDVDELMSCMADNCVFHAWFGDEVRGKTYQGKPAVRQAFAKAWEEYPDAQWTNARHFSIGDRGVSEWIFTGTRRDGVRVEMSGCDLFVLKEGKIVVKDSFRKSRTDAPDASRKDARTSSARKLSTTY